MVCLDFLEINTISRWLLYVTIYLNRNHIIAFGQRPFYQVIVPFFQGRGRCNGTAANDSSQCSRHFIVFVIVNYWNHRYIRLFWIRRIIGIGWIVRVSWVIWICRICWIYRRFRVYRFFSNFCTDYFDGMVSIHRIESKCSSSQQVIADYIVHPDRFNFITVIRRPGHRSTAAFFNFL